MKNSSLLKWANNKKAAKDEKGGNEKKWLHSPETLKKGHVAYLVKFLGSTEVDKPKGIEVVKQGIQKLKFNQQLKKSEGQTKPPKVELTISVEGVSILEPKTKKVLHQYPLHKISYCADDRAEKRFFSFISKEEESEKHTCFVFVSDKLAEEITLTIGQAFELAYKNYLDTNGKDLEQQKQVQSMQKRVAMLENENSVLKSRLEDLAKLKEVKGYMADNNLVDLCHVERKQESEKSDGNNKAGSDNDDDKKDTLINLEGGGSAGAGGDMDGFTLDDLNDLNDFNPRAGSSEDEDDFNPRAAPAPAAAASAPVMPAPVISTAFPPLPPRDQAKINEPQQQAIPNLFAKQENAVPSSTNPFASNAFGTTASAAADPFGMSTFETASSKANNSIMSAFGSSDAWGSAPPPPVMAPSTATLGMPAINAMSFEDLDPLRK